MPPRSNKKEIQAQQREWVRWLCQQTGKTPSRLALDAGLADPTLTRLFYDSYNGTLSATSIRALTQYTGLPGPDAYKLTNAGFGEEVTNYDYEASDADPIVSQVVRLLLKNRPGAAPKVIQTRALEEIGYLRGDVVIYDVNQQAKIGDLVAANVYKPNGTAETVLRIYRRAGGVDLLLPAADGSADPLVVDDERVKIMAVITESFRPRRTPEAA